MHMKLFKTILFSMFFCLTLNLLVPNNVQAQCAMCSLNAENGTQHGNTQGKGLNDGIIFLLAMPFLVGGIVAVVWYKKFRKVEEKSPIL